LNKNSLAIAEMVAAAAEDKKAQDTVILKLSELTLIADYFVITSGDSEPQLKAISTFIMRKLKESKIKLLDYNDVIVHIFSKEKREFYDLEYIWQEANKVRLSKRKKRVKE
jgi:ribosome-associated protein